MLSGEAQGSFRVTRYTRADQAQALELIAASVAPPTAERLIRQWEWKYDAHPFNPERGPDVLLLWDADRVVGMLPTFPLRVAIHGREYRSLAFSDFMLHPAYRGRGLSQLLIARSIAERMSGISWENVAARRAATPLSSGRCSRLSFLVRPLDLPRIAQMLLGRGTADQPRAGEQAPPAPRRVHPAGLVVEPLSWDDERLDALWERVRDAHAVLCVRDRAALRWRFGSRPDARYTLLGAARGPEGHPAELLGYVVFRVALRDGLLRGQIVDLLADPRAPQALGPLIEAAVVALR